MKYKIPSWVPEVQRPFNQEGRETWDVMTHAERQASWLFDAGIVIVVGVVATIFICWSR